MRKGEHGTRIYYVSQLTRPADTDEGKQISFLKEYTVFNIAQRAGLPESCLSGDAPAINQDQRDAAAQAILSIVAAPPSGFALPAV